MREALAPVDFRGEDFFLLTLLLKPKPGLESSFADVADDLLLGIDRITGGFLILNRRLQDLSVSNGRKHNHVTCGIDVCYEHLRNTGLDHTKFLLRAKWQGKPCVDRETCVFRFKYCVSMLQSPATAMLSISAPTFRTYVSE